MRTVLYIIVAVIFFSIGYKASQTVAYNKKMRANIQPVIDELKTELGDIQDKLKGTELSEEDSLKLNTRKTKIFDILATFYGYSTEQIKEIVQ